VRIAAIGGAVLGLCFPVLLSGASSGGLLGNDAEDRVAAPTPARIHAPVLPAGEDPGFLFQRPRVGVTVRGGMFFHRAGSDLYEHYLEEHFTLDRTDLQGIAVGAEVAAWIGARTEVALGMDGSRVTLRSESRDYVEDDGSPILQSTRITHGPAVSLAVRRYLLDRGEALGRFIWIPGAWNAFLGGGAAVTGYRFEQWGDFVNEELFIVTDRIESEGAAFSPFLLGGMEARLTTRTALVLEGRYEWGSDDLGTEFRGFEPMDLSGTRLTAGLSYRF
jgi:hypothetical protein